MQKEGASRECTCVRSLRVVLMSVEARVLSIRSTKLLVAGALMACVVALAVGPGTALADEATYADETAYAGEMVRADNLTAQDGGVAQEDMAAQDDPTAQDGLAAQDGMAMQDDPTVQDGLVAQDGEAAQDDPTVQDGLTAQDDETIDYNLPREWVRLSGKNAFATMQRICNFTFSRNECKEAVLATAGTYHDALTAASLAGLHKCPVFITDENVKYGLSEQAEDELVRLGV